MDGDAGADEIGRDVGLQVGEGQHEIGLEREDFRDVRRDEGRYPRLLAPDLRRPHGIAGDADDAVLLAEQIQRLHGLFGEADDAAGREVAHDRQHMPNGWPVVTAAITSEVIASLTRPFHSAC